MTKIIVTAKVEDPRAWENGFRSMGALLSTIFVSPIHYGLNTGDNSFAYLAEVEDLEKFKSVMNSEKAYEAQKQNGVIEGTVRIYALDKDLDF